MRTYGVNQEFRFVEGICHFERGFKSDFFLSKMTYFTSYVRNMFWATILYKYHGAMHARFSIDNFAFRVQKKLSEVKNTGYG